MTTPPPPRNEVYTYFSRNFDIFYMQMSCAVVNNATSGSGKVLSVARVELEKHRDKYAKWSYLEDNYRVSGNTEIGRPMTVLSTVTARARRWNVREIPFPK